MTCPGKLYRVRFNQNPKAHHDFYMILWKNTWVGVDQNKPGYVRNESLGAVREGNIILFRALVSVDRGRPREYHEILTAHGLIGYIRSDFHWYTLEPFLGDALEFMV